MAIQWPKIDLTPARTVIKELRGHIVALQHSVSVLLGEITVTTSDGNPYKTYQGAIAALSSKYEGTAEWGVQQVRNIVDVRSAFIIGQGIKLVCEDENSRELEYIKQFIKVNNLDEEAPQDLAKEAEIEGRCLVKMVWDEEKKCSTYRFVSYSVTPYEVKTKEDDYAVYTGVVYKVKGTDVTIEPKDFVYKKFAGRICKVNDVMPKIAMVLRHCEDLDKALYDWRTINNLFAAPTPYFKTANAAEAKSLNDTIRSTNWKIGKALCGTADFSLVGPGGEGVASLEKEIIALAKVISGATGVPVHFLGYPDLMSNRSTSTDLFESLNAATNKEKHVWEGFYEELFDKAIEQANANGQKGLTPGKVKAQIVSFTAEQMRQLVEIWLPLFTSNVVDLDYMLSKIPDADPEKIKKAIDEKAQEMLDSIKAQEDIGEQPPANEEQNQ